MAAIISLIESNEKSALIFAKNKFRTILQSPNYKDNDKSALITELLKPDKKPLIELVLNMVLEIKDDKKRQKFIWEIASTAKASGILSTLWRNVKHRQYIADRLLDVYLNQPVAIRKDISDMLYSFREYTGNIKLRNIIIKESDTKLQCSLFLVLFRKADKADLTIIRSFSNHKYEFVCRAKAKRFIKKYSSK